MAVPAASSPPTSGAIPFPCTPDGLPYGSLKCLENPADPTAYAEKPKYVVNAGKPWAFCSSPTPFQVIREPTFGTINDRPGQPLSGHRLEAVYLINHGFPDDIVLEISNGFVRRGTDIQINNIWFAS